MNRSTQDPEPSISSAKAKDTDVIQGVGGVRALLYILYFIGAAGLAVYLTVVFSDVRFFASASQKTLFFIFAFPLIGGGLFHLFNNSNGISS